MKSNAMLISERCTRIRANKDVDQAFLRYIIGSGMFEGYVKPIVTGVNVPHISGGQIGNFMFLLPPLPVQRKIAAVLSAYDDLIENNNSRIVILEKMAEEIYREWFVRMRFPGHDVMRKRDTDVGNGRDRSLQTGRGLPEGWEAVKLGSILELCYGKALKEEQRKSGNFPVYGSSGIVGYHSKYLVKGPGIIVGRKGNVGSINWCDSDFYPIDTVYYVKSTTSLYYLLFLLQSLNFLNSDAAVPGLNRMQAYSSIVYIPEPLILVKFDKIMKGIFTMKRNLFNKNEILVSSRNILLSRLITGKLSVEDLDIKFPMSMKEGGIKE
jgi:type I restriction enzyme S subunit